MTTVLREGLNWVGYVDWTVRDFHSYDTLRGATYNAYLVQDEHTALIDTVKAPFAEQLLENIGVLTNLDGIRYVVCNHAEPDHTGALPRVLSTLKRATLLCNKKCAETLAKYFDASTWKIQVVNSGETISLGRRSLQFFDTPMVHWPESMFTYVPEEKLLFSMDAFGQHWATAQRFDDEVALSTLLEEAKTYYANIVMPFGKNVEKALQQAQSLAIEMIAPSHGLIWRKHLDLIINAYHDWARCKAQPKVLVIYDSMWESTGAMAQALVAGAAQTGVQVQLLHVRKDSMTRIVTEVLDAAAVAFGSPTLNGGMMPMMSAALNQLEGLRPTGKAGLAFGSYGWAAKGGAEAIDSMLNSMKWAVLHPPIKSHYAPTPQVLDECRVAGVLLAEEAQRRAGS